MDADTLGLLMLAAPIIGILSILLAGFSYWKISKLPSGNAKMKEIADAIRVGAMAYLGRQNRTVAMFAAVIFLLFIGIGLGTGIKTWYGIAIAFLIGAVCSTLAGMIGMRVTTLANVRTTEAAKHGLNAALGVSFDAGMVMGLSVVGLGLIGIGALWFGLGFAQTAGWLPVGADKLATLLQMITGIGFGASLIAMFARVGGGIFTKGADVGADLVGKVEAGIPEDDPRNPAVIADNVGDNVGDCAGMGADLFESYVVTIIAAMILGGLTFGLPGVVFPLVIASAAILATFIGKFAVRVNEDGDPMQGLSMGIYVTALVAAVIFYFAVNFVLSGVPVNAGQSVPFGVNGVFGAALVGLIAAILIVISTDYYTSTKHRPVREIAAAAQTGAGTNVITGLAVGLESTAIFALIVIGSIAFSYSLAGVFGVAVATMAMLSLTGIIVAVDTFGPVSDNAGGIAEMSNLGEGIRKVTDKLDAVGNTTKATTKGFAIASAGLAALALLLAFAQEVNVAAGVNIATKGFPVVNGLPVINLLSPAVIVGLLLGGALPFIFSAFSMKAVGKAAGEIIREVRRQFKEYKIMEGKGKPDYAACVDICTKAALGELLAPGLLAVGMPLAVGLALGPAAVAGFLAGALVSAQMLAVFFSNAGGAWDNGKKYIESTGAYGGKKSDAHKAAVVGDTVGDPLKDTSGPALNPLIKIINTVSILFVTLFVAYGLRLLG